MKNKKSRTRLRLVRTFLFFTHYDVICDLLQYRRTQKLNLFAEYIIVGNIKQRLGNFVVRDRDPPWEKSWGSGRKRHTITVDKRTCTIFKHVNVVSLEWSLESKMIMLERITHFKNFGPGI